MILSTVGGGRVRLPGEDGGRVWLLRAGCAWLVGGMRGCGGGGRAWDTTRYGQ